MLEGGWRSHLAGCIQELEQALPEAERLGIAIAIENHQDADTEDLLALCRRFESRYLGITLDAANPLAVMEEPLEFARRLAPYLRHCHLKDYRIYPAPNGFRLVRCALGEGVTDFPALFRLFDEQEWPITRNIEMGALQARLIPMLERSWWDEFSARDARDILPALELVWNNLRPSEEEWRTPWEREADSEELACYEWEQFETSVRYLRNA
jgi:sugar phosphate isomerase/epimerase